MSAENVMKMMSAGELLSPADDDVKLEFAGQTWLIRSLVGDRSRTVLLLEGPDTPPHSAAAVIGQFLSAACVLSTALRDGPLDSHFVAALHTTLDEAIAEAGFRHASALAQRGKPS